MDARELHVRTACVSVIRYHATRVQGVSSFEHPVGDHQPLGCFAQKDVGKGGLWSAA